MVDLFGRECRKRLQILDKTKKESGDRQAEWGGKEKVSMLAESRR